MLLNKDLAEMLSKYSFIKEATVGPTTFSIYYLHEGTLRKRTIPRRATVDQAMRIIKNIEKEVVKTPFGKGLREDIAIVGIGEDNE